METHFLREFRLFFGPFDCQGFGAEASGVVTAGNHSTAMDLSEALHGLLERELYLPQHFNTNSTFQEWHTVYLQETLRIDLDTDFTTVTKNDESDTRENVVHLERSSTK